MSSSRTFVSDHRPQWHPTQLLPALDRLGEYHHLPRSRWVCAYCSAHNACSHDITCTEQIYGCWYVKSNDYTIVRLDAIDLPRANVYTLQAAKRSRPSSTSTPFSPSILSSSTAASSLQVAAHTPTSSPRNVVLPPRHASRS